MPWELEARAWVDALVQLQSAHFATGMPPQPPLPAPLLAPERSPAADSDAWHYRKHYLHNLQSQKNTTKTAWIVPASDKDPGRPADQQPPHPGLSLAFLTAHQPALSAQAGARSLLLSGIARLRSHPLLRGVAQRIPQRWQMQVKSWLRA